MERPIKATASPEMGGQAWRWSETARIRLAIIVHPLGGGFARVGLFLARDVRADRASIDFFVHATPERSLRDLI